MTLTRKNREQRFFFFDCQVCHPKYKSSKMTVSPGTLLLVILADCRATPDSVVRPSHLMMMSRLKLCPEFVSFQNALWRQVTILAPYILLPSLLMLCVTMTSARASYDVHSACNSDKAEIRCLIGCYRCVEAFGRKTYNMAACCNGEALT